jgi:hypothetical protein
MLIIVLPLSLALLIFAAGDWRRPDALSSRNLRGSLLLIASILASYHAYAYDLSLLILPILWISEYAQENKLRGSDRITLLGPIFILFFTPFYLLLLLRIDHFSAMALVLTLWFFGIRREIRRQIQVPLAQSA